MRFFSASLLIAALGLALISCDGVSSGPKIGVVDMNRLMRESAPGKAGLKFIETHQTELQAKLDAIQDKLEKKPNDEAAVQDLQKVYAESQQKIQSEGQAVVTKLFDAIQKELDAYRKNNGYAMLVRLEALDSFDPSLDVTNAVMAEVDKLKLDFAPAAAPAEEMAPQAPAAPAEAK